MKNEISATPARSSIKIEPRAATVSKYEDGWFVEVPDYSKPLDECVFIQVAGPFEHKWQAQYQLREYQKFARSVRR